MHTLTGGSWTAGFLDEHRGPGSCRIEVRVNAALPAIEGLYFVARRDVRRVLEYARAIGIRRVVRKIRSRLAEQARNEKHLTVGLGVVLEADAGAACKPGEAVVFVAPCHPRCAERIVVPDRLVARAGDPGLAALAERDRDAVLHADVDVVDARAALGPPLAGWSPQSGIEIAPHAPGAIEAARELLSSVPDARWRRLVRPGSPVRERVESAEAGRAGVLRSALFGLGHYAKSNIAPNLVPELRIVEVHEVDPAQVGVASGLPWTVDSSPGLERCGAVDAVFVAGYHHTHAPLAAEALRRGARAVVEKPLATTRAQREELLAALEDAPGRLYAGFHKRYAALNRPAIEALGAPPGAAIHYHAIVFEVKLPALHWYRWPNSCSRIVSNGCHWIDHFLFLNAYAAPVAHHAWEAANGDVICVAELANGAAFSLVLTDHGSARLGVRDHVELRCGETTATLRDGTKLEFESTGGGVRRLRAARHDPYAEMYRTISRRIVRGDPGDPMEWVAVSTALVLDLEEDLQASRASVAGRRAADHKETVG